MHGKEYLYTGGETKSIGPMHNSGRLERDVDTGAVLLSDSDMPSLPVRLSMSSQAMPDVRAPGAKRRGLP
jgi:hypothetical protein